MKVILLICMSQVILKLYETYKKYLGRGSGWIIDLVIYHILYILKYYPLDARIYMKLHKDLNHAKNGLINTEHFDEFFFRWCLLRYLHPTDYHPAIIGKIGKVFGDKLDLEDIPLGYEKNSVLFVKKLFRV